MFYKFYIAHKLVPFIIVSEYGNINFSYIIQLNKFKMEVGAKCKNKIY